MTKRGHPLPPVVLISRHPSEFLSGLTRPHAAHVRHAIPKGCPYILPSTPRLCKQTMTENASNTFSCIPILDYSLLSTPEGHAKFVGQLQHALIHVGFLYLSNPPVSREDMDALVEYAPRLFELPQEEKDSIRMANSPHFFGYSRLGAELTKGKTDQREQFDFGTPYENQWKPGDPEYLKLWGQPQVCLASDIITSISFHTQLQSLSGRRRSSFQGSSKPISGTSHRSSNSAMTSLHSWRRPLKFQRMPLHRSSTAALSRSQGSCSTGQRSSSTQLAKKASPIRASDHILMAAS